MTESSIQNKYADQANNALGKFTPFFIGLTFSILALSIQHPAETGNPFIKFFELVSWVVLLTSGILGLRHFQWRQVQFGQMANSVSNQHTVEEQEQAATESKKINKNQVILATWQRKLFYIGVGALMIARGWDHVVIIYCSFQ